MINLKTNKKKRNIFFKPNSEIGVLKLMIRISNKSDFHTIFWEFGSKLSDPQLFLLTWNNLITHKNDYINKFYFDQGFYGLLFDHYSFFLDINPIAIINKSNDLRIQLLSFLIDFLIQKWKILSSNTKHASYIWMRIFKFLNFSSPEAQVSIFLLISKLHKNLMKLTANSDTHMRINKMLDLMNPNVFVFNQLIELAIETGQLGSTQITLAFYVIKKHLNDQNDVFLLEKILMSPCPKNPLCILQLLLTKIIFEQKILANCIILTICKMIPRYKKINGFKEWLIYYINQTFEMLYCLNQTGKYKWKRIILVEIMEKLLNLKIQWISKTIRNNSSSILHICKCDLLCSTLNSKNIDNHKLQYYQNIVIKEPQTYKNPFINMKIEFPDKTLPTRDFFSFKF